MEGGVVSLVTQCLQNHLEWAL